MGANTLTPHSRKAERTMPALVSSFGTRREDVELRRRFDDDEDYDDDGFSFDDEDEEDLDEEEEFDEEDEFGDDDDLDEAADEPAEFDDD
jgi:hypothetical protein